MGDQKIESQREERRKVSHDVGDFCKNLNQKLKFFFVWSTSSAENFKLLNLQY